jgi:RNA polymerase sigma factor (sigma-70 family)
MGSGRTQAIAGTVPAMAYAGSLAGVGDGQLLERFTVGRDEPAELAFAALVRRHGPMVLRVCRQVAGDRHTAEDAFQATFLVLARRAGSIRSPERLAPWLHGVALRTAREARMQTARRRRREVEAPEALRSEPIDQGGSPDWSAIRREELEVLHDEVARLPETYRAVVVLCELEGLTYQEAALRLRCPVATVGVRLRRARLRLRLRLTWSGVAPTAALLEALFGADTASASLPSALVAATVRAATGLLTNSAGATGLASAVVMALLAAALRTVGPGGLKLASAAVMFAIGLTAGVGWLGGRPGAPHRAVRQLSAPLPVRATVASVAEAQAGPVAPAALEPEVRFLDVERPEWAPTPEETAPPVVQPGSSRFVEEERRRGERLFAREWAPEQRGAHGGDGLGPVFNDTSCVACHGQGGPGGAGPESKNVVILTAIPAGAKFHATIHPAFANTSSVVLHRHGTEPAYASWRQRFYDIRHERPPAKLNAGVKDSTNDRILALRQRVAGERRFHRRWNDGPEWMGHALSRTERNTPALFGAGRIDAVPEAVLVAVEASQVGDVDGRIGRTSVGAVGRFGWKSQVSRLHEFVRVACAGELGLEVPGHPQAASPLAPPKKAQGLDMTERECDALVAYVRRLPAPLVIDAAGPLGSEAIGQGRRLFDTAGCARCHLPTLGDIEGIYSDLLLHEMGPDLRDPGNYYSQERFDSPGVASLDEWRTPPLWGYRDSAPYLHDGRARDLAEAVALHGGQAEKPRRKFFELPEEQQAQVEAFLKSLVAPSWSGTPGVVASAPRAAGGAIAIEPPPIPEAILRRRVEQAAAVESEARGNLERRKRAAQAAQQARRQFRIARALEELGKTDAAAGFYSEIARSDPDGQFGRAAASRSVALVSGVAAP